MAAAGIGGTGRCARASRFGSPAPAAPHLPRGLYISREMYTRPAGPTAGPPARLPRGRLEEQLLFRCPGRWPGVAGACRGFLPAAPSHPPSAAHHAENLLGGKARVDGFAGYSPARSGARGVVERRTAAGGGAGALRGCGHHGAVPLGRGLRGRGPGARELRGHGHSLRRAGASWNQYAYSGVTQQ